MSSGNVAHALLQAPGGRERRDITREIDRQTWRALWRAEKRGRRLPFNVRQGASWVHAQRRRIAGEVIQALRSLGASIELANVVAAQACEKFPRDGVVITDVAGDRPRVRGTSPRQRKQNLRARGESPRQRGTSPRQQRAAADFKTLNPPEPVPAAAFTATTDDGGAIDVVEVKSIDKLAPEWAAIKAQSLEGLTPAQRIAAIQKGREERQKIERSQQRSLLSNPLVTDERS